MYLEKLEIQGFKSFANKNTLVFPGMLDQSKRGITSIVGPNGSGKSNVADAVRWALGEQSMKTLRGKKSEDIIFSGSDKKGKLGMAEVSLFLNNEDKQAPVDFSEIVITRRLYRNGDSEYILNNGRVRLSDIQMLLVKSKFGQKTYSVIGQGTVEGFLNTTLAERKEFFDEATGVKQFQIKRDESLSKLRSSYENLIQAQMLLQEIEPRLRSLTRQVNRLHKRDEIEKELRELQLRYYSQIWHDISKKFNEYNSAFLELEKTKYSKDKKLASLNNELKQIEVDSTENNEYLELQEELTQEQGRREDLTAKIARAETRAEIKLEANGKFDLSFLLNKKAELAKEIETIMEEINTQNSRIKVSRNEEEELRQEKEAINSRIETLNKELKKISQGSDNTEKESIKNYLSAVVDELRAVSEENDIDRVKGVLEKIKNRVKDIISKLKSAEINMGEIDSNQLNEIHEKLNKLGQEKEALMIRINENNLRISARSERVKLLEEKVSGLTEEIKNIEKKFDEQSGEVDVSDINNEQDELNKKLKVVQEKITAIKQKINEIQTEEEAEKSKLFALQKNISREQEELNLVNNKMNELKINSTRYETKLEDLEIEIRQELGGLKEVKEYKGSDTENDEVNQEKIRQLKRQLELIGGIDPQIEKEYNETKERHDFLSGQVEDFTKAVDSLSKIIKELDMTIKERFDKEFKIIAGNFEKYFKILFNGGTAKIIKVMENTDEDKDESASAEATADEEASESKNNNKKPVEIADIKKIKFLQKHNATGLMGIEIAATPPGKKIKSITMLSGGERALTAIALICAIISSNPSPFVVLDEVDAALDEANSERLAKILDELSHKTQFITITHNRATMRKANILYGVTMGDDGVSKLLSIKLDEAKEQVGSRG